MKNYEKKYVIYFDLLGFKDLIQNKSCDKIYRILTDVVKESNEANHNDLLLDEDADGILDIRSDLSVGRIVGNHKVTYCSDSVFITLDPSQITTPSLYVPKYISLIQFNLLLKGILIRGGVSYGDVYHWKNMIYGPAVNMAISIEKEMENNPFIGISDEAFQHFEKSGSELIGNYTEANEQTRRRYFDFLAHHNLGGVGDHEEVSRKIKKISKNLSSQLLKKQKELTKTMDRDYLKTLLGIINKLKSMKSFLHKKLSETIKKINNQLSLSQQNISPTEDELNLMKHDYEIILNKYLS